MRRFCESPGILTSATTYPLFSIPLGVAFFWNHYWHHFRFPNRVTSLGSLCAVLPLLLTAVSCVPYSAAVLQDHLDNNFPLPHGSPLPHGFLMPRGVSLPRGFPLPRCLLDGAAGPLITPHCAIASRFHRASPFALASRCCVASRCPHCLLFLRTSILPALFPQLVM